MSLHPAMPLHSIMPLHPMVPLYPIMPYTLQLCRAKVWICRVMGNGGYFPTAPSCPYTLHLHRANVWICKVVRIWATCPYTLPCPFILPCPYNVMPLYLSCPSTVMPYHILSTPSPPLSPKPLFKAVFKYNSPQYTDDERMGTISLQPTT
ncbi:hypothetical protein PoB_004814400 [Plakobranchus ocellatus]|uniref:Uncharacterized protein n=1 Tax=Plakobranchus ocellatus TaxID=259542 RepID=A0AAV4BS27_9GAST|nr:hypothetical protein PoB_004814400 [Plakobranchus ocellatus]